MSQHYILLGAIESFVRGSCEYQVMNKLARAGWKSTETKGLYRQPKLSPNYRARHYPLDSKKYTRLHIECSRPENVIKVLGMSKRRWLDALERAWHLMWTYSIMKQYTFSYDHRAHHPPIPSPEQMGVLDELHRAQTDEEIKKIAESCLTDEFEIKYQSYVKRTVKRELEKKIEMSLQHIRVDDVQDIINDMIVDSVMNG